MLTLVYDNEAKPEQLINISAMFAKCARAHVADTLMFAVVLFRGVLEEEKEPKDLDARLQALIAWVDGAGKELYNDGKPYGESSAIAKGGDLWKGAPGFSKERWAFWKERLQSMHTDTSQKLLKAMEAIESA